MVNDMKAKLIFKDWRKNGKSMYLACPELSLGSFHSGTTFNIEIKLSQEEQDEIINAIKDGYEPIFEFDVKR